MKEIKYELGEIVEYLTENSTWAKGKIHAVSQAESPGGLVKSVGYLIDTGRAERIDTSTYNPRNNEIAKRAAAVMDAASDPDEFMRVQSKISDEATDLPKDKLITVKTRQPEQVFVSPDQIRKLK